MRLLIISDIHANLSALDAVLEDAEGLWDRIWFLGDLVGYGPDPNESVSRLRELDPVCLSGNHDCAVLDKLDISDFNQEARSAALWTRSQLTPQAYDYLDALPVMRTIGAFTLAHGSPRHPVWEYILDYETAVANFACFHTPYCLFGHSHVPTLLAEEESGRVIIIPIEYEEPVALAPGRFLINPGSVGQPRDGDPRAAYVLLDDDELFLTFHRVPYAIEETQRRIHSHDLPSSLAERLAFGL